MLTPEQHKMRSQLAAQFMPFFRLTARILTFRDKKYRILTFRDKKYRILTFCDKTELYLTVLQQNNVEACLRCEASLSLAPSCSLLLSQAPYCSPNLRTTSSLGSQGPCSARSGAAALQHFMLLCLAVSKPWILCLDQKFHLLSQLALLHQRN